MTRPLRDFQGRTPADIPARQLRRRPGAAIEGWPRGAAPPHLPPRPGTTNFRLNYTLKSAAFVM